MPHPPPATAPTRTNCSVCGRRFRNLTNYTKHFTDAKGCQAHGPCRCCEPGRLFTRAEWLEKHELREQEKKEKRDAEQALKRDSRKGAAGRASGSGVPIAMKGGGDAFRQDGRLSWTPVVVADIATGLSGMNEGKSVAPSWGLAGKVFTWAEPETIARPPKGYEEPGVAWAGSSKHAAKHGPAEPHFH